jgi:hypothetical protein
MNRITFAALAAILLAACGQGDTRMPKAEVAALPATVDPFGELGDHHVIYVPTYSHVRHGKGTARRLATTLSVHNISFRDSILIHKVRYYNTEGRVVRDFLAEEVHLQPMQTYQVSVSPKDTTGLGANFLVEWEARAGVPAPLVEAVHWSTSPTVGTSFVTRGTQLIPNVVPDDFKP